MGEEEIGARRILGRAKERRPGYVLSVGRDLKQRLQVVRDATIDRAKEYGLPQYDEGG